MFAAFFYSQLQRLLFKAVAIQRDAIGLVET